MNTQLIIKVRVPWELHYNNYVRSCVSGVLEKSAKSNGVDLKGWAYRQRVAKVKGTLDEDREILLNNINFNWDIKKRVKRVKQELRMVVYVPKVVKKVNNLEKTVYYFIIYFRFLICVFLFNNLKNGIENIL